MDHYEAVARKVLALAAVLDHRIPDPDAAGLRVRAWADCFRGADVFETEALEAVRRHYSRPNPFPIAPGDVIATIKTMPVTSSRERTMAFIARWADYPYSGAIQKLTGLDWQPSYPTPEGVHGDPAAEREFHRRELRHWIATHGEQLVQAALNNPNPTLALEK